MKDTPNVAADRATQTAISDVKRRAPSLRRFETIHLDQRGDIVETTRLAPSTPLFESAFSAFARGAILRTDMGPRAVEDLLPGDRIETANGLTELRWKGTMLIVPNAGNDTPLVRIGADALGMMRPQMDVVLGPSARILHRSAGVKQLTGQDKALTLATEFSDGVTITEMRPIAPVQVFHLAFDRHEILNVGGIELESYHPGPEHLVSVRGNMLELFLTMFPHINELSDFGPLSRPRVSLRDLDLFSAA